MTEKTDVRELLLAAAEGDASAVDSLIPILYEELRGLARRRLGGERADHTLSTTALVHEAYFKLASLDRLNWQNRAQFMAIASRVMRQVLVDYARRRRSVRRGGGARAVELQVAEEEGGGDTA